jgi:hypothetical protein
MASTITERTILNFGGRSGVAITLDVTSYPTNGESLTAAILGLESSDVRHLVATSSETRDIVFRWDHTNNKLVASVASTGAEVGNATDIGTVEIIAIGSAG